MMFTRLLAMACAWYADRLYAAAQRLDWNAVAARERRAFMAMANELGADAARRERELEENPAGFSPRGRRRS